MFLDKSIYYIIQFVSKIKCIKTKQNSNLYFYIVIIDKKLVINFQNIYIYNMYEITNGPVLISEKDNLFEMENA